MKKYLSTGLILLGLLMSNNAMAVPVNYTEGPNNAGTGQNITGVGSLAWSNPDKITSIGSPYATRDISPGNSTNYLLGTDYDFDIPESATISGIKVTINHRGERNTVMGTTYGVRDNQVKLVKDGNIVGDNKATSSLWPSSFGVVNYGNFGDLWGTSWTPEEINSSGFGVVLSATTNALLLNKLATVDYIQITVYYSDTTAPELTVPTELTFEATGPTTPASIIGATAIDDIDPSPVVSYDPTALEVGGTSVTVTAMDASGNSTSTVVEVTITDTAAPTLTLMGNDPYDLYINNDYSEPGFSAVDVVDGDITGNVNVLGEDFDNTVLGAHVITYSVTDSNENSTSTTRTVNIVDRNKPIIYRTGASPVTVEGGLTYEDAGATAIDRDGSDITSSIVVSGWDMNTLILGGFEIYYDVTGAELGEMTGTNIADQAKRIVNVVDTTAPVITVNDPNPMYMRTVDQYEELGATASDIIDGDLTGSIDTNYDGADFGTAGTSTVVYTVTDSSGNGATSTREVIVRDIGTTALLSDLSTSQGSLDPAFDPNTFVYSVVLTYGTTATPETSATPANFASISVVDAVDVTSATSSNRTTTITVTAEDQISTSIYSIEFNVSTDTTAPVITILGDNPASVTEGDTYTDAGATATDNIDVTVTVITSGTVDTNTVGAYIITYTATDAASNTATSTRTVNVNERQSSGGGHSSDGGSTGGSQNTAGTDNSDDIIRLLGLLAVLGSGTEGAQTPAPALEAPALTEEGVGENTGAEVGGTPTTTEEVAGATTTEEGLPLAAAVGTTEGTNFSWLWWVVALIALGVIFYFYKKGKGNDNV